MQAHFRDPVHWLLLPHNQYTQPDNCREKPEHNHLLQAGDSCIAVLFHCFSAACQETGVYPQPGCQVRTAAAVSTSYNNYGSLNGADSSHRYGKGQ